MKFHRVSLLSSLAAATLAFWGAEAEASASVCKVTQTTDSATVPNTLRWCVDKVTGGAYAKIDIQTAVYPLDTTLPIPADVAINGYGATITPSQAFIGTSLIEIDAARHVELRQLRLDGGATFGPRGLLVKPGATLVTEELSVQDFITASDGGGIRILDASVHLVTSILANNTSDGDGGAISIDPASTQAELYMFDTDILDNEADWGGAVNTGNGSTLFYATQTNFEGNIARVKGGAVVGGGQFEGCNFQHNLAATQGGAIFAHDRVLVIERGFFNHNEADSGGAIRSGGSQGDAEIRSSAFTENVAFGEQGGGAVLITGGWSTLVNSTFAHNETGLQGASAIGIEGGGAALDYITMILNDNGAAGFVVSPSATADLRNSLLGHGGTNCDVGSSVSVSTSFANDSSCGIGATVVFGLPATGCGGSEHEFACTPSPTLAGTATCSASEDQLGRPRPVNACFPGSLEGAP